VQGDKKLTEYIMYYSLKFHKLYIAVKYAWAMDMDIFKNTAD
jgi:hypothetical protein